jgi:hypothetical protein
MKHKHIPISRINVDVFTLNDYQTYERGALVAVVMEQTSVVVRKCPTRGHKANWLNACIPAPHELLR